jgi:hypothetical protein
MDTVGQLKKKLAPPPTDSLRPETVRSPSFRDGVSSPLGFQEVGFQEAFAKYLFPDLI